jgi:hypothetical protein
MKPIIHCGQNVEVLNIVADGTYSSHLSLKGWIDSSTSASVSANTEKFSAQNLNSNRSAGLQVQPSCPNHNCSVRFEVSKVMLLPVTCAVAQCSIWLCADILEEGTASIIRLYGLLNGTQPEYYTAQQSRRKSIHIFDFSLSSCTSSRCSTVCFGFPSPL